MFVLAVRLATVTAPLLHGSTAWLATMMVEIAGRLRMCTHSELAAYYAAAVAEPVCLLFSSERAQNYTTFGQLFPQSCRSRECFCSAEIDATSSVAQLTDAQLPRAQ
jgi:hypothetical protein